MGISMSGGPYSYNRFDSYESMINEKKADKDYDGDGKVESGTDEYMGSKDKAIKKAMGKEVSEDQMSMYVRALGRMGTAYNPLTEKKKDDEPTDERKEAADRADEEKRQKKEGKKGEAHETEELEKIEDKELAKEAFQAGWEAALQTEGRAVGSAREGDSNLKGQGLRASSGSGMTFTKAAGLGKDKSTKNDEAGDKKRKDKYDAQAKKDRKDAAKERSERGEDKVSKAIRSVQDEEFAGYDEEEALVMQALLEDGLVNNIVSAETMMVHMSDEWFQSILAEMGPAYPSETKAQAKAQSDHREGKSSKGEKTGKNPGLKMSHTSGANRQD